MKQRFTLLLFALLLSTAVIPAYSQVSSSYMYVGYSNFVYPILNGGTALDSATTVTKDSLWLNVPIGFNFNFNCNNYNTVGVSSNGFIWFGGSNPTKTEYNPISSTAGSDGIISAYGANLVGGTSSMNLSGAAPAPVIRYTTSGTAPNRTFSVEWRKVAASNNTRNSTDMQIRLTEGSGKVEIIVWDWPYFIDGSTTFGQVGIRGASNTDFLNRSINSSHDWCSSIAGTSNTDNAGIYTTFQCEYATGSGLKAICYTYFPVGCTNYWNIQGRVFHDLDSNCTTTTGEPYLNGIKVKLFDSGHNLLQQMTTFNTGNYYFHCPLGDYTVEVDTSTIPYSVLCPIGDSQSVSVTVTDSLVDSVDFRLICKTGYDVGVSYIYLSGLIRPNKDITAYIYAGDFSKLFGSTCNTALIPGQLVAVISGPVKYVRSTGSIAPTRVSGDSVIWNIANLSTVNISSSFQIVVHSDTDAHVLDHICVNAAMSLSSGTDTRPANNNYTSCRTIYSSFDPNYKEVSPEGTLSYPYTDWLTYTIHFQNTGTADAINIQLIDTLDARIDPSSFQFLASSHNPMVQVKGNYLFFTFTQINLPDSTVNKTGSMGYVSYRVKLLPNAPSNINIHNSASVYFDSNAPVKTNTTSTPLCAPIVNNITAAVCRGEVYNMGGTTYNASGKFDASLFTGAGCDSTVNLNLTVLDSIPLTSLNVSICKGDAYDMGGNSYTTGGTYNSSLSSIHGCDSVVNLNLTVLEINAGIDQHIDTLIASGNGTVQWKDCTTGNIISGASGNVFVPSVSGTYAAIVSNGNCTQTTQCANVTFTGISNVKAGSMGVEVYPNPAGNVVNIVLSQVSPQCVLTITDVTGRNILAQPLTDTNTHVNISSLAAGIYFLEVNNAGQTSKTKLVKE